MAAISSDDWRGMTPAQRARRARELGYVVYRCTGPQRLWRGQCEREGIPYIAVQHTQRGFTVRFDYGRRPADWPDDFWARVQEIIHETAAARRPKIATGGGWGTTPLLRDPGPLVEYLLQVAHNTASGGVTYGPVRG